MIQTPVACAALATASDNTNVVPAKRRAWTGGRVMKCENMTTDRAMARSSLIHKPVCDALKNGVAAVTGLICSPRKRQCVDAVRVNWRRSLYAHGAS